MRLAVCSLELFNIPDLPTKQADHSPTHYQPCGGAKRGVGVEGRGARLALLRGLGRCFGGVVGAQGLEDASGCGLGLADQELTVPAHHDGDGHVNGNDDINERQ